MKTQLIFLGAPGSGKGTQAAWLVKEKGLSHLSTGDLLREEVAKGTELGKKVSEIMSSGNLVDDDTVMELLKNNCDLANHSYIFDGYPRNIEQVKVLDDKFLKSVSYHCLYFKVDTDKLVRRITARRVCSNCNSIYNVISLPPKQEGVCDSCGESALMQRKDDTEEVVKNRIEVFLKTMVPVLEYYQEKNALTEINASNDVEEVRKDLVSALEKRKILS